MSHAPNPKLVHLLCAIDSSVEQELFRVPHEMRSLLVELMEHDDRRSSRVANACPFVSLDKKVSRLHRAVEHRKVRPSACQTSSENQTVELTTTPRALYRERHSAISR